MVCVTKIARAGSHGGGEIDLEPVISGSEENASFYQWTPAGKVTLNVTSKKVFNSFEVDKEYYIDFTEATAK